MDKFYRPRVTLFGVPICFGGGIVFSEYYSEKTYNMLRRRYPKWLLPFLKFSKQEIRL